MTTRQARTTGLRKGFVGAGTGLLMVSLVSFIVPTTAFATVVPDNQQSQGDQGGDTHHGFEHQNVSDTPSNHQHTDGTEAILTVKKVIVGNHSAHASDFSFTISNGEQTSEAHSFVGNGTTGTKKVELDKGSYTVTEVPATDYTTTYSGDCGYPTQDTPSDTAQVQGQEHSNRFSFDNSDGHDGAKTCTITNTYTPPVCTLVSDTTTVVADHAAVLVTPNRAWTTIEGASWIWGEDPIVDTTVDETEVFTKTFTLDALPSSASIQLAVDNGYVLTVNGTDVDTTNADTRVNYHTPHTYDILSYLHEGSNTIVITAKNLAMEDSNSTSNPAGVLFKVSIVGSTCTTPAPKDGGGDDSNTLKVHIMKYLKTSDGEVAATGDLPAFPMTASWSAKNIGEGTGSYTLNAEGYGGAGAYAADTSAMSVPADYSTNEVPDGNTVLAQDASCSPGKYRLVGYQTGSSLSSALDSEISTSMPSFQGLQSDAYVVVVNEKCPDAPPQHHHSQSQSGSNNGDVGGGSTGGQVLGASTSTPEVTSTCEPLLTDYLKLGWKNNPDQVKKLQTFLNTQLHLNIPVTGFFGQATWNAVKLFQKTEWDHVLQPWFGVPNSGIKGQNDATGAVYQTTRWHINNLVCPGSEAFPTVLK